MKSWSRTPVRDVIEPVRSWDPLVTGVDKFVYVDLSAVDQEHKRIIGAREVRGSEAPSRARQLIAADDILVSTVRPNLNAVARVPQELDGATASTGFCVLRPKDDRIDPGFLFHWVRGPTFVREMTKRATGANYPAVSDRIVLESEIPLPPLCEQRRIAAILDAAEALKSKRKDALEKLDALAQSIFVEVFGDPASNPKGWDISTVGAVADVQGGLQVTRARHAHPCEVPYLRVANVFRGYLDLQEIKTIRATEAEIARTVLCVGDLLIVEGHGNQNEIGRAALWDGSVTPCVHQNHLIRVRFQEGKIDPAYACEYLNSAGGRRHFLKRSNTTSGLNTISVADVRATPIAIPPLPLQQKFSRAMSQIAEVRSSLEASQRKFESLSSSLQHRVFRGEL